MTIYLPTHSLVKTIDFYFYFEMTKIDGSLISPKNQNQ